MQIIIKNLNLILTAIFLIPKYLWIRILKRTDRNNSAVFIVGCGHSGTTLLLSILGSHPNIFSIPNETQIGHTNSKIVFRLFLYIFKVLTITSDKKYWVEKTPSHIRCIDKIFKWNPDSKIILIIRDGRDVSCSIKNRTGDLIGGINRWVNDNNMGREYWNHPCVYTIKYESLIINFKSDISKLLNFIDEKYDTSLDHFYQQKKNFYTNHYIEELGSYYSHNEYRNWQINQPIYDARGLYKSLSNKDLKLIEEKTKPLLRELGYL